jgi:Fic family protein
MGSGSINHKPTPYRDGQNVIKDSASRLIVYMPPIAKDVPVLMKELTKWIEEQKKSIPMPILAAIAHYQYATIHPYYDGNGRTARLLTTLILHLNGYGMNGIYSLEEYYAKDLQGYYEAISTPEPNYYDGRAQADITKWILYFTKVMAKAFESVRKNLESKPQEADTVQAKLLYELDTRQKKVLDLFLKQKTIKSADVALVLGVGSTMESKICSKWVDEEFIKPLIEGRKGRSYVLGEKWKTLME